MERKELIIKVDNVPGGDTPYSIRIEDGDILQGHPYFREVSGPVAVARNSKGFVIRGVRIDSDLMEAEKQGGATKRIALIDAADALKVSQDIIDN